MGRSASLGDALQLLETHQDRGAVVHFEIDDDIALLSYSVYEPNEEGAVQISEAALATTIRAIRELCGPELVPSEVLIPRAAAFTRAFHRWSGRTPSDWRVHANRVKRTVVHCSP
jgi:hypothetical protein